MGEVEFISDTNVGILNRKNPKIINNCNKTSKGTKKFAQKKIAKKTPSQFCQVLSNLIQKNVSINCYCLTLKKLAQKTFLTR